MPVRATPWLERTSEQLRLAVVPWPDVESSRFGPVLDRMADAAFVLLGEASHGTHEFYRARARLTQRLIEAGRCDAVMAEADWPDAYRVNRYVRSQGGDASAVEALGDFVRFPRWMWRNQEVVEFMEWLREFNRGRAPEVRVGFYGLDLYSLHASIAAVLEYLERIDPAHAHAARQRYACFEDAGNDPQNYGLVASVGADCEAEAIRQLQELYQRRAALVAQDGWAAEDEYFFAEQNARLVQNAERYYRGLFSGRVNTWNLRDRHMAETLEAYRQHLGSRVPRPRIVVWAHNSHLGDARATEMKDRNELNLGQLMREAHGRGVFALGFTTYAGTVAAASDWGSRVEHKVVRPALPDSIEHLMHETSGEDVLLDLRLPRVREALDQPLLERAIGVIYRPQSERHCHYFHARVPAQFDALVHFDWTRAVAPLDAAEAWPPSGREPETYPSGF